ncbi:MAG: zinc-dependent metalloprotease, partial [Candidatus Eremiobacteraeota bacterium]|nr:zinc-dependent metalloprotease [Candidatus Eremiobacteraeota bacterium]
MNLNRFSVALLALSCYALASPGGAGSAQRPSPSPSPSPSTLPSALPSGVAPVLPALSGLGLAGLMLPGQPQPYATFVRKTERQSGLIDLIKKDDDIYLDLGPDQLAHPFIVAPVLASGIGAEAFAGRVFSPFVVTFKRVGRRVLWVEKNTDFSAPPDTSAANALAISVTDSVINSTPIVAEDTDKKRVVVSGAFFLTDFENVGKSLSGPGAGPVFLLFGASRPAYAVDTTKSYIARTKALPKNDEILASLAFSGPPGDVKGAPDGRGVRLAMHYSIVEPPAAESYVPRIADDRVGYFITAHQRFDNDNSPTPFVRYIDRWNFGRGPLVYYLTNEIPQQYKPAIRAALLKWNAAFAKIGIANAVEVRDQPSDPNWDPDDVRYSTVRWLTSDNDDFAAYGPYSEDPRTGEILRVEIVIAGETMRAVKRGYVDEVVAARGSSAGAYGLPVAGSELRVGCDAGDCDRYGEESAALAALGSDALRYSGATPAQTERYAEDWLEAAVLHESGHNFGLRHNFLASTLYPLARLHDKKFTDEHGLTASVMGYAPVNLSPPGKPQGDYFQLRLGPYDEWALRYGYERFPNVRRPEDELAQLRGIADESTRPGYAFETDEDAEGELALDPRVSPFVLSSDPLAFDKEQFELVDGLLGRLDGSFPRFDEPYYQERRTFETMLLGYERAALLASKYVGGIYTSRDHRGQFRGAAPFAPVPREQSRRAFDLLSQHLFSSRALHFSPHLLDDLAPDHYLHRGVDDVERPDFPIAEVVGAVQDAVMFRLFSPDVMSRLADQQLKVERPDRTMSLDDLFAWMQASVWDDVPHGATSIDPLRRSLQQRYTNLLIAFSLAPSFVVQAVGFPSDTAPLAR